MGLGIPIIADLVDGVKDLVSEAIVDKDKKLEINLELSKLADEANKRLSNERIAQIEVNRESAKSEKLFVAGARPAAMWVGVVGMGYATVLQPLMSFVAVLAGYDGPPLPNVDTDFLVYILGGLLGLPMMLRSFDKKMGTATDDLSTKNSEPVAKPDKIVPPGFGLLPENAPWER